MRRSSASIGFSFSVAWMADQSFASAPMSMSSSTWRLGLPGPSTSGQHLMFQCDHPLAAKSVLPHTCDTRREEDEEEATYCQRAGSRNKHQMQRRRAR